VRQYGDTPTRCSPRGRWSITVIRLWKNSRSCGATAYPAARGSQGTLALVTEATLRLRPAPPPRATLLAFFPSLEAAGEAVSGLAVAGLGPVTLELMDRFTIRAVDDMHHLGLDRDAAAMLLVESDLPGGAAADEVDAAERVATGSGATLVVRARDPQEAEWLRQGRRLAYRALEALGTAGWRTSASRGAGADIATAIEASAEPHVTSALGHAGDGNLHPTFVLDRDEPESIRCPSERARSDLYEAALALAARCRASTDGVARAMAVASAHAVA